MRIYTFNMKIWTGISVWFLFVALIQQTLFQVALIATTATVATTTATPTTEAATVTPKVTTKADAAATTLAAGSTKPGGSCSPAGSTTPSSGRKNPPKKVPITRELSHDRCGDPFLRFHYKKFDFKNIAQSLTDMDACCSSPFLNPESEAMEVNEACCLVQGSKCEEGGILCCKNAKCSMTPSGDMKCPFESGFWMTSRRLTQTAVQGWRPTSIPRLCLNDQYPFFREVTLANLTLKRHPVSACCAIQDTTESNLVRRYCCINKENECCFSNGYCTAMISSYVVSYEERENDFQTHLDDKILEQVVYRT